MTTSKPFSTISYNSVAFLKAKLDECILNNTIDFYFFIEHFAEDDEKKNHIHLYIVPSTKVNTNVFLSSFDEIDKKHNLPLRCKPARRSHFSDAYLYFIHDEKYLVSKGQSRRHHYTDKDIFTSDKEYLNELVHTIDRSKFVGLEKIVNAVESGYNFSFLVRTGQIPVQLIHQYQYLYELLKSDFTYRNGGESHTPADKKPILIDDDTGEILTPHKLSKRRRVQGSIDTQD